MAPFPRLALILGLLAGPALARPSLHMPYAQAGLTPREAAVHLLGRLTYGPRPGEVERLAAGDLNRWAADQLEGRQADPELDERLGAFPSLRLDNVEVRSTYITRDRLLELAARDGIRRPTQDSDAARRLYDQEWRAFQAQRGFVTLDELFDEVRGQKLVRAVYARNQLREVLTDFWFNHFNVGAFNNNIRYNVLDYENRGLRPQALEHFESMLSFTAHHPCMLYYLNNAQSLSPPDNQTKLQTVLAGMPADEQREWKQGQPGKRKTGGVNENYARELMELHTLGVDGGYSQKDVTEVARAFTGWTVLYRESPRSNLTRQVEGKGRLGYQREGDFLFRADWHDATEKEVLGGKIAAGGGVEEGEGILRRLAEHPATAHFVCRKLARRFVSDQPPAALVDRMAVTFRGTHGDIAEVLATMLNSPEFWAAEAVGAKVKSPLELVASTLRTCGAEFSISRSLYDWTNRLGENLYLCQPPTGYSEESQTWLSPGSLVNRFNYAVSLVNNRIGGVSVDLSGVNAEGAKKEEAARRLATAWVPGRTVSEERLGEALVESGDGYGPVRQWFLRTKPGDFEGRRKQSWRLRVAATIFGSPEFQIR